MEVEVTCCGASVTIRLTWEDGAYTRFRSGWALEEVLSAEVADEDAEEWREHFPDVDHRDQVKACAALSEHRSEELLQAALEEVATP